MLFHSRPATEVDTHALVVNHHVHASVTTAKVNMGMGQHHRDRLGSNLCHNLDQPGLPRKSLRVVEHIRTQVLVQGADGLHVLI